jgi:hypothetical protein
MNNSSEELEHLIASSNKIITRQDTIYQLYKSHYPFITENNPYIASGIYISDECDGNIPCKHYINIEYNSTLNFTTENIKIADFYTIRRLLISNTIALPTHFLETEEHRNWRLSHKSDIIQLRTYTHYPRLHNLQSSSNTSKCLCCTII